MTYNYEISTFVEKTEILKYLTGECNNPLDYMRAAMAAIWSGVPSSIYIATRFLIISYHL
jgi:hypothetical protein